MSEQTEQKIIRELEVDGSGVLLPFKTKAHKYNIIRPGEPMGISRWTEYTKLSIVLGTGKTLSALIEAFKEIELLAVQNRPYEDLKLDIVLLANSHRRAIIELSKARYDYGLYQASLFIIREGDEGLDWSLDLANEYITDWKENGISEQSLFFFATETVVGLKAQVKKLKAEMDRQTGNLLAISGLDQTEKMS